MGDDAEDSDLDRPESALRGSAIMWRAFIVMFVLATAGSLAAAQWLSKVPDEDASGRRVLHIYLGHPSDSWFGLMVFVAATSSSVLAAGLLVRGLRHVLRPWRLPAMLVGWAGWLCGTAYLALIAFFATLTIGFAEDQMTVKGPDGARVILTMGYDGDIVDVWRPATSSTYFRDPGVVTIDPWDGPCSLDRKTESQLILTCGSTSQLLPADP